MSRGWIRGWTQGMYDVRLPAAFIWYICMSGMATHLSSEFMPDSVYRINILLRFQNVGKGKEGLVKSSIVNLTHLIETCRSTLQHYPPDNLRHPYSLRTQHKIQKCNENSPLDNKINKPYLDLRTWNMGIDQTIKCEAYQFLYQFLPVEGTTKNNKRFFLYPQPSPR
jgi:hypothetical protein